MIMKQKDFDKLVSIYLTLKKKRKLRPSFPFVPYVGKNYKHLGSPARILFIGKATNSWEPARSNYVAKPLKVREQQKLAKDFVENKICSREYNSLFWWFLLHLTHGIDAGNPNIFEIGLNEKNRQLATSRFAWSNLIKIGDEAHPTGLPLRDFLFAQQDLCLEILEEELSTLKPTAVILTTHGYLFSFVCDLFGRDWYERHPENRYYWKTNLPAQYGLGRVYWGRHPQGWRTESRNAVMADIIRDQTRFLRKQG